MTAIQMNKSGSDTIGTTIGAQNEPDTETVSFLLQRAPAAAGRQQSAGH
jgi:hypothetical protein